MRVLSLLLIILTSWVLYRDRHPCQKHLFGTKRTGHPATDAGYPPVIA